MKQNNWNSIIGLGLVALGFLTFILLNNQLFSSARLDLTENGLYTLSDGSEQILAKIDEPINLHFFFSAASSKELTGLRAYARQVEELLLEYELAANGKIKLTIIDPQPFSEDEDLAAEFGLQSVPINNAGDSLYFGLAGTNAVDEQQVIAFFQPDKEAFLEYEISKLVQNLVVSKKPIVGILSSLKVQSDVDMQTFQTTPAWLFVDQLGQLFELETVAADAEVIDSNIDLLIVIHPKELSDQLLYGIDQFVMAGGKMLAFVDPLAERDRPSAPNPMMPAAPSLPSDLRPLLAAWGIEMRPDVVLGDAQTALTVTGPSGQPQRHMTILGMGVDNFQADDVTLASLESINFSSVGILDTMSDGQTAVTSDQTVIQTVVTPIQTVVTPLISSSVYAQPLNTLRLATLADPADLQQDFKPTGEVFTVAARLSGSAVSAFPEMLAAPEVEVGNKHISATDNINVIVVADTDLLSDHMWVQVQDFFGQRIASPWANNGDFVINAVDNLVGSSELIKVRSRGRFSRPFDVVQELQREAEAKFLQNANDLQAQLAETERQLGELEASQSDQGILSLTPQQELTLGRFQEEKLRIRRQLREVRRQLDKDIEQLGSTLKFINIALVPIILTLMLLVFNYLRRGRGSEYES
ncbi:MAG: Gldg family protein [Pseudomonadales bacterium]|nr:Gldg family protein [Pseudomonadales bacterium]